MEHFMAPPRALEYAWPCTLLARAQIALSVFSFAVTWYRVWWDSLIALAVGAGGYYAMERAGSAYHLVKRFRDGCIFSLASHVIAISVVLYYTVHHYIVDTVASAELVPYDPPGWILVTLLLLVLISQIVLKAFSIMRVHQLMSELSRNSVFTDHMRGGGVSV